MSEHPTPENIMKLGTAFWASKTLLSAVELGVFTALGKGPRNAKELTADLGLHPRSARDFFDTLVSLHMLEREGDRYSNAPDTGFFLDKGKKSYLGGMLEMLNQRLFGFWNNLTEGLKTGLPQNEAKQGGDLFGELYANPAALSGFLSAMTGISMGAAMTIAHKFPWKDYKTFVDVGGAQGALPVQVALAHPHLTGTNYDLAPVGPIYGEFVKQFGLSERLKFTAGDFFASDLPKADVIVMGHILHDWDLPTKKMLVKKAYDALPSGGSFVVYEALIDDDRRANTFGLLMSLNMLIETPGGFDYTGADCRGWMLEAGFKEVRVEHLVGPDSMVVGVK